MRGRAAGGLGSGDLRAAGQVRDQGVSQLAGALFEGVDLAPDAGPVVVVVRSEVLIAHAGVGQQLVVDLQLGVADGDAGYALAAAAGELAVAGAFAGAGLAG